MNWKIFNNNSIDQYIDYINLNQSSGIWHSVSWLDFQIKSGKAKDGFYFGIESDGNIVVAGLLIIYSSKNGLYGYIPSGFLYTKINNEIYDFFLKNIQRLSLEKNLIFTQIDWIVPYDSQFEDIVRRKKNHNFNVKLPIPQFTNVIRLNLSYDEILDQMKPKGRYNIKLSEKKGVKVEIGNLNNIPAFYKLLEETTARDGFRPNSQDYYSLMLEKTSESILLVASHENDILAAGIFTFTKNQGLYYYGASSNLKRNLMAPYLMQWHAIKLAKDKGCKNFDFMGIANPDDPKDHLGGVTDFKLKFGGEIIKFNSPYHIVHKSLLYNIYKVSKFIRVLLIR